MRHSFLIVEFMEYLKIRKRYWLLPLVFMLILLGFIMVVAQSSTIGPYVYAFF